MIKNTVITSRITICEQRLLNNEEHRPQSVTACTYIARNGQTASMLHTASGVSLLLPSSTSTTETCETH